MSGGKYTTEEKYRAIEESRKIGINATARKYQISNTTLQSWIANYESMGIEGVQNNGQWTRRTETQKHAAVIAYLEGNESLQTVCKKFKIRSTRQLRNWIKKYNGHEQLKTENGGGGIHMTKGRNVAFEEKVEIVQFCIASDKDYAAAMDKYRVSYQQVYSWVRKYESGGVGSLEDRRGKAKAESALTETDRLRGENKILAGKIKRLEMENDMLKKLEEIERRWS